MLKHFPARTDGYKIEEYLHSIYDSDTGEPVSAVEVFGPPEAMRKDANGEETGPWVVGLTDEVTAYAEAFATTYDTGIPSPSCTWLAIA